MSSDQANTQRLRNHEVIKKIWIRMEKKTENKKDRDTHITANSNTIREPMIT